MKNDKNQPFDKIDRRVYKKPMNKTQLPRLVSKVPLFAHRKGVDERQFVGGMVLLGAAYNTAKKVFSGRTDIYPMNVLRAAQVLGVRYEEVIVQE